MFPTVSFLGMEKEMKMHGHKGIRIVEADIVQTFSLGRILILRAAEALEEGVVVFCIFKDTLAVDSVHHDMKNSYAR